MESALERSHGIHIPDESRSTIMRTSGLPWNWNLLSHRIDLPIEFLIKNSRKMTNYEGLSKHPDLTPELMKAHPEIPWTF